MGKKAHILQEMWLPTSHCSPFTPISDRFFLLHQPCELLPTPNEAFPPVPRPTAAWIFSLHPHALYTGVLWHSTAAKALADFEGVCLSISPSICLSKILRLRSGLLKVFRHLTPILALRPFKIWFQGTCQRPCRESEAEQGINLVMPPRSLAT